MNVLEKILEDLKDMRDIMGSSVAMDCFGKDCEHDDCTVCVCERAMEIIRSHMDDIPNDGWIPVEERLPDIDTDVIITDRDGNVYTDVIYGFAEESDKEPSFNEWTPDMWQNYKYDAIAWMRSPEPYKAE